MVRSFILCLLVCLPAFAEIDTHRTLGDWDQQCGNYVEETKNPLSFQDVKQFIASHRVTSVSGFVAAMETDKQFKPFLKSFVLMHHSQSLQRESVDPEHPRVIFYHRGLVMAVVDNPNHPNPTVEVIQYTPSEHRFAFNQVDFSNRHPFRENPFSCTECHGEPKLPIWHTYRTWPGAYNNSSEWLEVPNPKLTSLPTAEQEKIRRRFYGDDLGPGEKPPTEKEWMEMRELFLPVPRQTTGIYAYLQEPETGDDSADLTRFLTDLDYQRITWELAQIPHPERYRYALIGALLRCRNLPEFLGPKTRAELDRAWGGRTVEALERDVGGVMRRQFDQLLSYAARIGDENAKRETAFNDEDDAIRYAGLRYFFEPLGVNVKRFSLNFPPGEEQGYGMSIVGAGGGGWRFGGYCRYIPDSVRADPALTPLLALEPVGSESVDDVEKDFCPLLREQSRKALP